MLKTARKVFRVLGRELDYRRAKPRNATLALTDRCNLRCRSCGVWQTPSRKDEELDFDTIERCIAELRDFGIRRVSLIEGEPLLRPDIVRIVQSITDAGMDSEMTTNAVLLRGDLPKKLIQAGLGQIMVSIDAPNEVHDSLRGAPGIFEKTVEGVRNLVSAKETFGLKRPTIHISCLLSSENVDYLDDWLDFAEKIGVDGLNFAYPTFLPEEVDSKNKIGTEKASTGKFVYFDDSLLIDPVKMKEVLATLREIRQEGSRRGLSVWVAPDMYLGKEEGFLSGQVPARRCALIKSRIIVGPYGGITPCALMDKYSYGSVLDQKIEDLWLNDRHRDLIARVEEGLDVCRYCRCHFGENMTLLQQLQRRLKGV